MYGKIFYSMYDGTLAGDWKALVTMQQLIVLADADGIVDMTTDAISRRTSIPIEIIEAGLLVLEAPDPHSRTPDNEGRRIERLDAHRPWGWHLVNHEKYKHLRDSDEVRQQNRDRQQRFRDSQRVTPRNGASRKVTRGSAESRHTDTDTDTDKRVKGVVGLTPDAATPAGRNGHDHAKVRELRKGAIEILTFLNEKTGRNYEPVPANVDMIVARLRQGATVADCRAVVAKKCREWAGDEKMAMYLRPATLFNATKFAQYKGEIAPAAVT